MPGGGMYGWLLFIENQFCGESKTPSGVLLYILNLGCNSSRLKLPHNGEKVMGIEFDDYL
jgi:hypothetical protein